MYLKLIGKLLSLVFLLTCTYSVTLLQDKSVLIETKYREGLYVVSGHSMYPTLFDGDVVKLVSDTWKHGDIVIADTKIGKLVKRVEGSRIVGDNRKSSAVFNISEVSIIGKVKKVNSARTSDLPKAYAAASDYLYGKKSDGTFSKALVSDIFKGTIANDIYKPIAISGDGNKLYGFNSSGVLVYEDLTSIAAGTISTTYPAVVSPDDSKIYGSNGSKILYQDASSIATGSINSGNNNMKISVSNNYIYGRASESSYRLSKIKISDVKEGTIAPGCSSNMALSPDSSKIFGFSTLGSVVYQQTGMISSGILSSSYHAIVSPDGSKLYGFDSNGTLTYQNAGEIGVGSIYKSSNSLISSTNIQCPGLSIIVPAINQAFDESDIIIPSIQVSDIEGRELTVKYTIEPETEPREVKTITSTSAAQTVGFNEIHMRSVTKGHHRVVFEADNGTYTSRSSIMIYVDKAPPTILGSGTGQSQETFYKGAVTPNGYRAFLSGRADGQYITIFNDNFQKVNSFKLVFSGNDGVIYYPENSSLITLISKSDNTFCVFGNLYKVIQNPYSSVKITGYMVISTDGVVTDAKTIDTAVINRINTYGNMEENIIYSTDSNSLKYIDNNLDSIGSGLSNVTSLQGKTGLKKLTGDYCAAYNNIQYSIIHLTSGQVQSYSFPSGTIIRDIANRNDGTTLISYSNSSGKRYIRILNIDFSLKKEIDINSVTYSSPLLVPLDDGSVLMTFGSYYSLLQRDDTLDPSTYRFKSPSGNITTADLFKKGEIILMGYFDSDTTTVSSDNTAAFESISYYKIPIVDVLKPTTDEQISETNISYEPSISVSDVENRDLTCKYYIDFEAAPRDTVTVSNTLSPQTVNFNPININTLSVGSHTIKFEVSNGINTYISVTGFKASENMPTISAVTTSSTETSITVTGDAVAKTQGLHSTPFRYTIGEFISPWTSDKTYTKSSLIPNTFYVVKFEARDIQENTSSSIQNIFTKAQTPAIILSGITSTTIDVNINDSNPDTTQYLISAGTKYVDSNGMLSDTPTWTTVNNKKITIYSLVPDTIYTIKAKARNGAGIETGLGSSPAGRTLVNPPDAPLNISASSTEDSITIIWDAVQGSIGYDVELDGAVSDNGTNTTFTINGLTSGTQHIYRVRARLLTGTGNWSGLKSISTLPQAGSNIPANLAASASSNSITITWDVVVGALGYDIEADGNIIDSGTNTVYTHSGLSPDTQHTYRVRARMPQVNGEWTNIITKSTLPYSSGVPVNLISSASDTNIKISWDSVPDVLGYDVEVDGVVIDNGSSTIFDHTNLTPKTVHNYRIRARKSGGNSDWSSKLIVATFAYGTPANITATASSTSITITWNQVEGATGYEVMVDSVLINNGNSTTYIHNNLLSNTQHTYMVRVTGPDGTSSWSQIVSKATATDNITSNIATISTNSKITVLWSEVSGTTAYEIDVNGVISNTGTATSYVHNNPAAGVHTYKVRTKISDITSDWSMPITASVLPTLPSVPSNITTTTSFTSVQLTWSAVSGATGYDVEVDGVIKDNGASTVFIHSDLTSNTTHTYKVRAKNASGVGPWSSLITAATKTIIYSVACTLDEQFDIMLTASNISNPNQKKYIVTYDQIKLDVIDLCSLTTEANLSIGSVADTDIAITESVPGRIVFTVGRAVDPGKIWSGTVNSIRFKSKVTEPVIINYNIQANQ